MNGNTSAKGWDASPESYEAARRAADLLMDVARVRFVDEPLLGPGAVVVLIDGKPAGWMDAERFAEFRRRLAKEGL